MTGFLQACGAVLLAVILILSQSANREMGILLSLTVCTMVIAIAVGYLQPVVDFLKQLEGLGNLDGNMVGILLKVAGIGMVSEIACLVCSDAGNASLGKAVQMLASAVMLWLSIPLMTALMELLQRILGAS